MQTISANGNSLSGCNLIDASAGCGKTYKITRILLDLILEKGLELSQILVVTFTEAATGELKDRIRKSLREACAGEKDERKEILDKALLSMDEAAIYTIHGFCRRILTEHAFESGALYGAELAPDTDEMMRQTYSDYLRKHFIEQGSGGADRIELLKSGEFNPFDYDAVHEVVTEKLANPDLLLEPDRENLSLLDELVRQAADMFGSYQSLREIWTQQRGEIRGRLLSPNLSQVKYKQENIDKFCADMDTFFGGADVAGLFRCFRDAAYFDKFTARSVREGQKKGTQGLEDHDFFRKCQEFKDRKEQVDILLEREGFRHYLDLFDWFSDRMERLKKRHSLLTFDDLILVFRNALRSSSKDSLIESMTKRFRAVLVDEFQDTDPLQYEIFRTLFFENPDIVSYMIGDPKQSIYAFRGADVFSYLNARQGNGRVCRAPALKENHRSDEGIISAVNTLFGKSHRPFIIDGIDYENSEYPSGKNRNGAFTWSGRSWKPLEIFCIQSRGDHDQNRGLIKKEAARRYAAEFVVSEIKALLAAGAIEGKALRNSDIAVLVRTGREARLIRKALAAARIHAVYYASESVFGTDECAGLITFLKAVHEPKSLNLVRQALMTPFFGLDFRGVYELEQDPGHLEEYTEKFFRCHDAWLRKGFTTMLRSFISDEGIKVRILSGDDGERRMANLLQLMELCQQEIYLRKCGPPALIAWCEEERADALSPDRKSTPAQEHLLRLESDEYAVRILTIHRSKGLEFPVVFVPFCWDEVDLARRRYLKIHQQVNGGYAGVLCLGKKAMEAHSDLASQEELAENMRLLYVAVTRARHRCYMCWGAINRTAKSSCSLLFHYRGDSGAAPQCGTMKNRSADEVINDLKSLAAQDQHNIGIITRDDAAISGHPEPPSPPSSGPVHDALQARSLPPPSAIEKDFRISSFTGLISGAEREAYVQDFDSAPETDEGQEPGADESAPEDPGISGFPGGSRAGSMFHSLLELLDFQEQDREKIRSLVQEQLARYGFTAEGWIEPLAAMLGRVMEAELNRDGNPFSLGAIAAADRLSELRFHFPVTALAREDLRDTLASLPDGPTRLERLAFSPFKGYITGSIDCVVRHGGKYYIFDWKSNHLGSTPHDYGGAKLDEAMSSHYYFLQYFLYTMALDQYLTLRLGSRYEYDAHFGGIYYLFLRGIHPPGDGGIYFARPSLELVADFREKYISSRGGRP